MIVAMTGADMASVGVTDIPAIAEALATAATGRQILAVPHVNTEEVEGAGSIAATMILGAVEIETAAMAKTTVADSIEGTIAETTGETIIAKVTSLGGSLRHSS